MNLIEFGKSIRKGLWDNAVLALVLVIVITAFVWFLVWLKGQANEGVARAEARIYTSTQRENWCYEQGYFEVVSLNKLQKGHMCVDARDREAIKTLIIPEEISK